jgi:hypothetical protein
VNLYKDLIPFRCPKYRRKIISQQRSKAARDTWASEKLIFEVPDHSGEERPLRISPHNQEISLMKRPLKITLHWIQPWGDAPQQLLFPNPLKP